jgi:hypothetical protein
LLLIWTESGTTKQTRNCEQNFNFGIEFGSFKPVFVHDGSTISMNMGLDLMAIREQDMGVDHIAIREPNMAVGLMAGREEGRL